MSVQLVDWNPLGHQFIYRFNHLVKPFDNPKIRQAAMLTIRQEDYLKATVGEPEFYKVCTAAFICGTPNAFDVPGGLLVKPDFEKAKALLKEAGYDGTPIVLMQSTDLQVLTNLAPVAKAQMERAGFKVDMQSMDWQTLVARRVKKDPPSAGGWNAAMTSCWHLLGASRPTASHSAPVRSRREASTAASGSVSSPARSIRTGATAVERYPCSRSSHSL